MAAGRVVAAIVVIAVVAVAALAAYESYFVGGQPSCLSLPQNRVASQTSESSFGAVTEYRIPGQDRWPNGVTTASDGSVWFAEQELPGIGHLYPNNGTIVEYQWPGYPKAKAPDCIPWVSAPGIAVWNGRVWASDEFGNSIIGVSPGDGKVTSFNTTTKANFPYWLAVGPDGALWFTSYDTPAKLGRIAPDMTLSIISLQGLGQDEPLSLKFVNSTLAFLSATDQSTNSTTGVCVCTGHVYSFDPSAAGSTVTAMLEGGSHKLVLPTSVAYGDGSVWVAQHGGSSVAGYDFASGTWRTFPTSLVSWSGVTLPLDVEASGGKIWFNEHYANKIALLDPTHGVLTEFTESNPPATGASGIQNDLSIAAVPGGLWFTSLSGNYVGFVSSSYSIGFSGTVHGNSSALISPGSKATFIVDYSGNWYTSMNVNVSDSENLQSIPESIQIVPSITTIPTGTTSFELDVAVSASQGTAPGKYTVAITVTEEGVQETSYLFITVT